MTRTIGTVRQIKCKMDAAVNHFAQRHPFLCCLGLFIGGPLLALLAVLAASAAVLLPLALICGWL